MLDIFNHKDIPLYMIDIPYGYRLTHTEYFTRIPWGEYKRIRFAERIQSIPDYELKIKIFRDYTVRTPKWTEAQINVLPAGIIDTVANLILYVSDSGIIPDSEGKIDIAGFVGRLDMYRAIAQTNVEYQMYTVICLVFKAYTFEMLDKLPFDRISALFASAERYLLENGILKEPLKIYDPTSSQTDSAKEKLRNIDNAKELSITEQFLKMKQKQEEERPAAVEKSVPAPAPVKTQPPAPPKATAPMEDISYIAPKDSTVVSNGIVVNVPGIEINRSNQKGGFDDKDYQGPFLSEDEALAMQMEMGYMPAGYDLYLARQEKEKKQGKEEAANAELNSKIKPRKKFRRK